MALSHTSRRGNGDDSAAIEGEEAQQGIDGARRILRIDGDMATDHIVHLQVLGDEKKLSTRNHQDEKMSAP